MKKEKKIEEEKTIKIPPMEIGHAVVTIIGMSPLLVNKWSAKAEEEIKTKQEGGGRLKRAPKNPIEEFNGSLYRFPGNEHKYGVPAGGIKQAAVSACRFAGGMSMTLAKGAFHIMAGPGNLIEIKGSEPVMDEQMVRVGNFGNKKPTHRYRGRFDKWEITFAVKYNERVITPSQLLNLFEHAGFSVGLCEWRPEKGGSYGMFEVKKTAALKKVS